MYTLELRTFRCTGSIKATRREQGNEKDGGCPPPSACHYCCDSFIISLTSRHLSPLQVRRRPTAELRSDARRGYRSCISFIDHQIGRLLNEGLEASNQVGSIAYICEAGLARPLHTGIIFSCRNHFRVLLAPLESTPMKPVLQYGDCSDS